MTRERGKRIYRPATEAERSRHENIRARVAEELPELKHRARERLAILKRDGTPLRQVMSVLRAERKRLGLSLTDLNERTGIDRAALSRLENNEDANPTLATIERYAQAVGKQVIVLLSETPQPITRTCGITTGHHRVAARNAST